MAGMDPDKQAMENALAYADAMVAHKINAGTNRPLYFHQSGRGAWQYVPASIALMLLSRIGQPGHRDYRIARFD